MTNSPTLMIEIQQQLYYTTYIKKEQQKFLNKHYVYFMKGVGS